MRRSLLSVCIVLLLGAEIRADQVTLKNGDRISGKIVSGDGKTLQMKSEFAGDVSIQWGAITGIESSQKITLTLKDGSLLSGKVSTQDGKFVVAGEAPARSLPPCAMMRNSKSTTSRQEEWRIPSSLILERLD